MSLISEKSEDRNIQISFLNIWEYKRACKHLDKPDSNCYRSLDIYVSPEQLNLLDDHGINYYYVEVSV